MNGEKWKTVVESPRCQQWKDIQVDRNENPLTSLVLHTSAGIDKEKCYLCYHQPQLNGVKDFFKP